LSELVITDNQVREEQHLHKRPPTLDQLQEQLQRQINNKEPVEPPEMLSAENIDQEVAFRLLKLWRSLKGDAKWVRRSQAVSKTKLKCDCTGSNFAIVIVVPGLLGLQH